MRSFVDGAGRTWTVRLTLDALKRVRALLGVDLLGLDLGEPPLVQRLATDVVLLCDVIFAVVKPEADAAGVTDEQFGAALGGESIREAVLAFHEELSDFFRLMGRGDLVRLAETNRQVLEMARRKAAEWLDRHPVAETAAGQIDEALAALDGGTPSTGSPGSSDATPEG